MGEAKRFSAEMTVGEALSLDARTKWVLAAYHIGGCASCALSDEETLEELARGYGLRLEELLEALNGL